MNATGYGIIGAVEDQDEYDIRNQFEVNFWGTLNIVQLSLPYFRERSEREGKTTSSDSTYGGGGQGVRSKRGRGGGRYLVFNSTSGGLGVPGLGPYCATKYAIEGLVESMVYEVDAFDIKFTLVESGFLKRGHDDEEEHPAATNSSSFAEKNRDKTNHNNNNKSRKKNSSITTTTTTHDGNPNPTSSSTPIPTTPKTSPSSSSFGNFILKPPSATYASPTAPAGHAKRVLHYIGENHHQQQQPTTTKKAAAAAAEIVWQLAHCGHPPMRLCLGGFAVESLRERLRGVVEEVEEWKWLDF